MTPKEKAKELYNIYFEYVPDYLDVEHKYTVKTEIENL